MSAPEWAGEREKKVLRGEEAGGTLDIMGRKGKKENDELRNRKLVASHA